MIRSLPKAIASNMSHPQLLIQCFTVLLCTLAGMVLPTALSAQSLTLFDIDTSAFPAVSAKFYAFDGTLQQTYHTAAELSLKENGLARSITSVTCPPPTPPRAISAVLTIDISQSMATGLSAVSNLELAKAGARAWLAAIPLGKSECAVTAFDDANYFIQDFTTDAAKLSSAINNLLPDGGTDYNYGLIRAPAGALQATLGGQHQKIIVFLTDGRTETTVEEAEIVAEAKRQSCLIFVVAINYECPQSLKNICVASGGTWFSDVASVQEIESIYREILAIAQSGTPCTITWQGTPCPSGYREVELTSPVRRDTASYELDATSTTQLVFSPKAVFYRPKTLFAPYDTTITVTASNGAINVTDITSSNPAYTIAPKAFVLSSGQSITLTISYSPPDSGYTFTEFAFVTNVCTDYYFASGGYAGQPARVPSLRLVQPNGGETFVAGMRTKIQWTGVPSKGDYKLEYSTNSGTNWNTIVATTTGLEYDWVVPNTPSITCLVRVMSLSPTGADAAGKLITFGSGGGVRWNPDGLRVSTQEIGMKIWNAFSGQQLIHVKPTGGITSFDWSADATLIAICGAPYTASIWSAQTGLLVHNLVGHSRSVRQVRFSPDGSKVATVGLDTWGTIWDCTTGNELQKITGHALTTNDAAWNPQGTQLVTVSYDASGIVYNTSTGAEIPLRLANHTGEVLLTAWSPDGARIATAGVDNTVMIWDANAPHALLQTLSGTNVGRIRSIQWNPDGTRILSISTAGFPHLWNAVTGQELTAITAPWGAISCASWSRDGLRIGTGGPANDAKVWEANTGNELRSLPSLVSSMQFSPDGYFIATTSTDGISIWGEVETPSMIDTSDAVFAIVKSTPQAIDINMRRALVNTSKDSVVAAFVSNAGTYPFQVDSVVITGLDSAMFAVVSGNGPYILTPASTRAIEIRFRPAAIGLKYAALNIYTSSGKLVKNLSGEGIQQRIVVVNNLIDFGQVDVGATKSLTQVATIKNTGTVAVTITGVRQMGPNTADFTSPIIGQSFTIQPGGTEQLADVQYTATQAGRTSGQLLFDYVGIGSPASVMLFGEGIASTSIRGKAAVRVGTASAKTGDLVNIPITLIADSNIANTGATAFSARLRFEAALLEPMSPLAMGSVIGSDRIVDVTIPLQADGNGVLTTFQFLVTASIDSVTAITLENMNVPGGKVIVSSETGQFTLLPNDVLPVEVGTASIQVGSVRAKSGEIVTIPIILVADSNLSATLATSITGQVRFNATLLEPLTPLQFIPLGGDLGGINVTLPLSPRNSDTLATMQFRTALGNDSVCALTLENMQAVGGSVTITYEPGIFKLEGICLAGGPRLINPTGQIDLSHASPNPIVNGYTEVTLETSEMGATSLVLSDMQGRVVKTFLKGDLDSGRRIVVLDFVNVASGTYMLTLRTPTERRTIRIEVAK